MIFTGNALLRRIALPIASLFLLLSWPVSLLETDAENGTGLRVVEGK